MINGSKITDQQVFPIFDINSNCRMKQEILNYEYELIEKQQHYSEPYLRVSDPHNLRYSPWRLHEIIEKIVPNNDYSIKWIGSDPNAHVLAFLYCMLTGCLTDSRMQDDVFLQFKYSLYQQSKQSLSISQQKIFVQHLGLVEDSKNISQFLKKSNHLQAIFTKLFLNKCSQMNRRKFNSNLSIKHIKNEELQWFSGIFPFIRYKKLGQSCFNLNINRFNFFIIEEKDCFFILEQESRQRLKSLDISEGNNRRKIRTQIYGQSTQYISEIRGCGMIDSKYEIPQNYIRNHKQIISRSQSRQDSPPLLEQIKNKNEISIQQRIHSMKKIQQSVEKQKNNYLTSKIERLINNQQPKKSNKKQRKQLQGNIKSNVQLHNMRVSIKDDRLYRLLGTPKISQEKISQERKDKNRSSRKKRKARIYSPPNQMPQIIENQQILQRIRGNNIYQSLNRNEAFQLKRDLSPKNRSKIPKFLIKKNEDPGYTFNNSQSKQRYRNQRTLQRENIPGAQKQAGISGAIKTMIGSYKETGSFTKRI